MRHMNVWILSQYDKVVGIYEDEDDMDREILKKIKSPLLDSKSLTSQKYSVILSSKPQEMPG